MLRRIALLAIGLVFASPCFADAARMKLEDMIQRSQYIVQGKVSRVKVVDGKSIDEEYEVLSALINGMYLTGHYKSIVITNPTCCENDLRTDRWHRYVEELTPISVETLDDYAARNKQSLTFEKRFNLKAGYRIVPYVQIEKLFDYVDLEGDWKTFYSKYPGSNGYVRLSRVGFNKAKDQALVNTHWMRGSLSGEGHYVLLGKQDGSWKVLKKVGTWVV